MRPPGPKLHPGSAHTPLPRRQPLLPHLAQPFQGQCRCWQSLWGPHSWGWAGTQVVLAGRDVTFRHFLISSWAQSITFQSVSHPDLPNAHLVQFKSSTKQAESLQHIHHWAKNACLPADTSQRKEGGRKRMKRAAALKEENVSFAQCVSRGWGMLPFTKEPCCYLRSTF